MSRRETYEVPFADCVKTLFADREEAIRSERDGAEAVGAYGVGLYEMRVSGGERGHVATETDHIDRGAVRDEGNAQVGTESARDAVEERVRREVEHHHGAGARRDEQVRSLDDHRLGGRARDARDGLQCQRGGIEASDAP